MGIGHRKYNQNKPDPRVSFLITEANKILSVGKHLKFALAVEARTVTKKSNLILNVESNKFFMEDSDYNQLNTLGCIVKFINPKKIYNLKKYP